MGKDQFVQNLEAVDGLGLGHRETSAVAEDPFNQC